jgi:ankyrin repeat protein
MYVVLLLLVSVATSAGLPSQSDLLREDEEMGGGALHVALQRGDAGAVRAALDDGVSLSQRDPLGYTALHRAADEGSESLTELLLERGAAKGAATSSDSLRRQGSAIDSRDNNDATPLMLAAGGGHFKVVDLLARAGANLAAQDEFGLSPLHYAAEGGHVEAVAQLLSHGANPDAMDEHGKTPADVARAWGFPQVVEQLGPSYRLHGKPVGGSETPSLPDGAMPLFPSKKADARASAKPPAPSSEHADHVASDSQEPETGAKGGRRKTMRMPDNLMPEKLEL